MGTNIKIGFMHFWERGGDHSLCSIEHKKNEHKLLKNSDVFVICSDCMSIYQEAFMKRVLRKEYSQEFPRVAVARLSPTMRWRIYHGLFNEET